MMIAEVHRHCLIVTPIRVEVTNIGEETDFQVALFAHTAAGEGMGFPGYRIERFEDTPDRATVYISRD